MLPDGSDAHLVLMVKSKKHGKALLLTLEVYRCINLLAEHFPLSSGHGCPHQVDTAGSLQAINGLCLVPKCVSALLFCGAKCLPWESSQAGSGCLEIRHLLVLLCFLMIILQIDFFALIIST